MTSSTKPPAGGAGKPAAPNSAAASGPTKRAGAASPPSTPQPAAMRQREDALALLAAVAHRHELRDIEARCRAAIEQAHGAVVNVAVLGKFKAGKSTLLNRLLGADVLPVQAIPATAVITRVRFGPALKATVHKTGGETLAIEPSALADWVTETGNPGNARGASWVEVESPGLAGLERLVLVDTPGTGGTWEHHTATSLSWLPNVGAALLVVNGTHPLGDEDLTLIEQVRPHTPTLIVVLSKMDLMSEADQEAVLAHVRGALQRRMEDAPAVLPFSIADEHAEYREQLRALLRRLDDGHVVAAEALAAHRVGQLASECRDYLEVALAAASSHAEAIGELRVALDAEASRLPELRQQAARQLEPINKSLTEHAQKLARRHLRATVERLDRDLAEQQPTWTGSLKQENERFRAWLRPALSEAMAPVAPAIAIGLDRHLDDAMDAAARIGEAFVQRLGRHVAQATGVELSLPAPDPRRVPTESVEDPVSATYESPLELLSPVIPMGLARTSVRRRMRNALPWEVEKNLSRVAYRTAKTGRDGLQQALDLYIDGLAAVLDNCRRAADASPADVPAISADLGRVRGLA